MRRLALILAAALLLVAVGTADAKKKTLGSSLTATPTVSVAKPVDTLFWNVGLASGAKVRSPGKGSINVVRVKGRVLRHGSDPVDQIHFQVLHPIGHGKVKVTVTSGPFRLPVGGDPNHVSKFKPINICVHKGDYVALHEIGGYQAKDYPSGTPFEIFAPITGSASKQYSSSGGAANGSRFKGSRTDGRELLMQMKLGTGKDSAPYCR